MSKGGEKNIWHDEKEYLKVSDNVRRKKFIFIYLRKGDRYEKLEKTTGNWNINYNGNFYGCMWGQFKR